MDRVDNLYGRLMAWTGFSLEGWFERKCRKEKESAAEREVAHHLVLEIGARGTEGSEVGHPVGEEGCEAASPEEPAPGGMAGTERIVTD